MPQTVAPVAVAGELEIDALYDRDHLRVGDSLRCTVQVLDAGAAPAHMIVLELSVPPGFAVDPSAFKRLVDSGTLARYEMASDRVVVYVRSMAPKRRLRFSYELKALRSLRAQVPPSCVYEYYQPQNRAQTPSREIVVD